MGSRNLPQITFKKRKNRKQEKLASLLLAYNEILIYSIEKYSYLNDWKIDIRNILKNCSQRQLFPVSESPKMKQLEERRNFQFSGFKGVVTFAGGTDMDNSLYLLFFFLHLWNKMSASNSRVLPFACLISPNYFKFIYN